MFKKSPRAMTTFWICWASSRVGARIKAWHCLTVWSIFWRTLMEKVAVFPVPDWAWAMTSWSLRTGMIALCWIADGRSKPRDTLDWYYRERYHKHKRLVEARLSSPYCQSCRRSEIELANVRWNKFWNRYFIPVRVDFLTLKIGKSSRFCHDCKIILVTSLFFVWVKVEEFFVWLSKKIGLIEKIFLSFLDGKIISGREGRHRVWHKHASENQPIVCSQSQAHRNDSQISTLKDSGSGTFAIAIGNKKRRTLLISSHVSIACSRNSKDSSWLSEWSFRASPRTICRGRSSRRRRRSNPIPR